MDNLGRENKKEFLEELEATGGDLAEWIDRKSLENESFTGLELDPEKLKRLNSIKALCATIHEQDQEIGWRSLPLTYENRHGSVQLVFPSVNFWSDKRFIDTLSQLFKLADHVHLSVPRLIALDDEDGDEDEEQATDGIVLTFGVADMWHIYGKAPF